MSIISKIKSFFKSWKEVTPANGGLKGVFTPAQDQVDSVREYFASNNYQNLKELYEDMFFPSTFLTLEEIQEIHDSIYAAATDREKSKLNEIDRDFPMGTKFKSQNSEGTKALRKINKEILKNPKSSTTALNYFIANYDRIIDLAIDYPNVAEIKEDFIKKLSEIIFTANRKAIFQPDDKGINAENNQRLINLQNIPADIFEESMTQEQKIQAAAENCPEIVASKLAHDLKNELALENEQLSNFNELLSAVTDYNTWRQKLIEQYDAICKLNSELDESLKLKLAYEQVLVKISETQEKLLEDAKSFKSVNGWFSEDDYKTFVSSLDISDIVITNRDINYLCAEFSKFAKTHTFVKIIDGELNVGTKGFVKDGENISIPPYTILKNMAKTLNQDARKKNSNPDCEYRLIEYGTNVNKDSLDADVFLDNCMFLTPRQDKIMHTIYDSLLLNKKKVANAAINKAVLSSTIYENLDPKTLHELYNYIIGLKDSVKKNEATQDVLHALGMFYVDSAMTTQLVKNISKAQKSIEYEGLKNSFNTVYKEMDSVVEEISDTKQKINEAANNYDALADRYNLEKIESFKKYLDALAESLQNSSKESLFIDFETLGGIFEIAKVILSAQIPTTIDSYVEQNSTYSFTSKDEKIDRINFSYDCSQIPEVEIAKIQSVVDDLKNNYIGNIDTALKALSEEIDKDKLAQLVSELAEVSKKESGITDKIISVVDFVTSVVKTLDYKEKEIKLDNEKGFGVVETEPTEEHDDTKDKLLRVYQELQKAKEISPFEVSTMWVTILDYVDEMEQEIEKEDFAQATRVSELCYDLLAQMNDSYSFTKFSDKAKNMISNAVTTLKGYGYPISLDVKSNEELISQIKINDTEASKTETVEEKTNNKEEEESKEDIPQSAKKSPVDPSIIALKKRLLTLRYAYQAFIEILSEISDINKLTKIENAILSYEEDIYSETFVDNSEFKNKEIFVCNALLNAAKYANSNLENAPDDVKQLGLNLYEICNKLNEELKTNEEFESM